MGKTHVRALVVGLTATIVFAASAASHAGSGNYAYDRALAERRAQAVKAEMIRLGIAEDNIFVVHASYGRSDIDKDAGGNAAKDQFVLIKAGY
jgi:hypothetical protein